MRKNRFACSHCHDGKNSVTTTRLSRSQGREGDWNKSGLGGEAPTIGIILDL